MTLATNEANNLVSTTTGEIDRRIFTDQEIFDEEMRQIFGRAWLFLCHESQISKPGDFFEAPMGRDNVLVVRQRDNAIRALINSCTHRGNAVCRAEEGNTRNFMCTYHGWTFDLGGDLVGVPGFDRFYKSALDKKAHGLRQVAQLDTYKGFVFATMDPTAPSLVDFLGATGRLGLDLVAERGDMKIVPGIQKFVIDCNWKFAVDNSFDWYHPQITHMSVLHTGLFPEDTYDGFLAAAAASTDSGGTKTSEGTAVKFESTSPLDFRESMIFLGQYGHAIGGPPVRLRRAAFNEWRKRPGVADALGPLGMRCDGHPNIFPTLWATNSGQVSLRVPRSPNRTEIWWFTFDDDNAPPEARAARLDYHIHVFGPAGILEQDDGENWAQSTMTASGDVSARIPQAVKMNVGGAKILHEDGLARIEGQTNEHAQLWLYNSWAAWMSTANWDELRDRTTPGDTI